MQISKPVKRMYGNLNLLSFNSEATVRTGYPTGLVRRRPGSEMQNGEGAMLDSQVGVIQPKGYSARTNYPLGPVQKKPNNTGLPDNLKEGVENLSGYSMDDVKVHYNSDKPAQLQALAYAQGTDIHVGPGQEQHLPHEAWHVVQQKQGRVQPTMQMKGGVAVNDDKGLESEADVMGGKAINILMSGTTSHLEHTGKQKNVTAVQLRRPNLPNGMYNRTNEVLPIYLNASTYLNDTVYENIITVPGPLTDFVRIAARRAGMIGSLPEIVNATRFTSNGIAAALGQEKWVISAEDMDQQVDKPHSIEPFNVKFSGTYSVNHVPISITYHFGNYNNGYIMIQSENLTQANIKNYLGGPDNRTTYSNVHANTENEYDVSMNDRMTGLLTDENTWDARTILAGEGARFSPVRILHQNGILLNNSKFFTDLRGGVPATLANDLVAVITLSDLWGIWTRRFPGQFNISSASIANILRQFYKESSDKIDLLEYGDMQADKDFDLDRNRVH